MWQSCYCHVTLNTWTGLLLVLRTQRTHPEVWISVLVNIKCTKSRHTSIQLSTLWIEIVKSSVGNTYHSLKIQLDLSLTTQLDPALTTQLDPALTTQLVLSLTTQLDPTLTTQLALSLTTQLALSLTTQLDLSLTTQLDLSLTTQAHKYPYMQID